MSANAYQYRLSDNPERWLTVIAPGKSFDQVIASLKEKFGERFVEMREGC